MPTIFASGSKAKGCSELSRHLCFVSAMRQRWPQKLWIVRHGQSAGNVARDAAHKAGLAEIDIAHRDVDVPLSELGQLQARALGQWFASLPEDEKPEIVLSSPYVRARQTARAICEAGGIVGEARPPIVDERLREREFGIFDRLTTAGIRQKYPELAEQRALLGKFYHRAPGGESWADVILRLRSALDTVSLHHADRRVLIVCHQVVVLCLRYILEEMDEAQILAIDKEADVLNCGVCAYEFEPDDAKMCVPEARRLQFRGAAARRAGADHFRARRAGRRPMSELQVLDSELLKRFPLPRHPDDGDKEERGRILVVAGSRELPGAPCSLRWRRFVRARASSRSRRRRASRCSSASLSRGRGNPAQGDGGRLHRRRRLRSCVQWAKEARR
jgi:broad specificity phosphatase PhoE